VSYYVDCEDKESQECLAAFTDRINKQMTLNCQIPFSLPTAAIAQIVGEAKRYFYNAYDDSMEEIYISCPYEVFMSDSFRLGLTNRSGIDGNRILKGETKKDRGVLVMPDNIFSVLRVYQVGKFSGEAGWGSSTRLDGGNLDFGVQRMFASSMYNDRLPQAADNLVYWTCNWSFFDTARQMLQEMHGFSYNRLTKKLRFTGELPTRPCVFHVLCAVSDCALFDDDLFFRYCVAMCMKQMSRILGMFQYNLPGNVTINYDMYTQWGDSELQEIKEEINNMRHSVAYFFTT
jgi:hypothetical protein